METIKANICKDHTGVVEIVNIHLDNCVMYKRHMDYGNVGYTYYFRFGRFNGNTYCRVDDIHREANYYFKIKDIKIQLSDDLYWVFERYLSRYVSELREYKIDRVLNEH